MRKPSRIRKANNMTGGEGEKQEKKEEEKEEGTGGKWKA